MKIASIAVGVLSLAACYSTGDGPDPTTPLYFPVGLAVSPAGNTLYVANSDFDLQFNSGTVEAYRLKAIRDFLKPIWSVDSAQVGAVDCAALGLTGNGSPLLYPGACGPFDVQSPPAAFGTVGPIADSARIGAFATDILFACRVPEAPAVGSADCSIGEADPGGARLFVPVRGDPSITFFDVDDDRAGPNQKSKGRALDCEQGASGGRCPDSHRIGLDPSESIRALTLPAEPFALALSDKADAIAVTHQIPGGAVSLVTGLGPTVMDGKPRLDWVQAGLPAGATGIAAIPTPAVISATGAQASYQEGFAVTYRGAAVAEVFRFFNDQLASPTRPFLSRVGQFPLAATPNGLDSRGIAIDRSQSSPRIACENVECPGKAAKCIDGCASMPDDQRMACETGCSDTKNQCLATCTRLALPIFVANRSPPALLVGEVSTPNPTGSTDFLAFYDAIPLAAGPSRVVVGKIKNRLGEPETRVFAICFDARIIYIYDPIRRRVDGQIRTGRGPHALVMDPTEPIAYLGHFTDSYIGVIDLDQSHDASYASLVATIGVPQPPKDSK